MALVAAYGFDELIDQLDLEERAVVRRMIRPRGGADRKTRWRRLSELMQELGPTFVKLGQILSTRSDLLPAEAISELKRLQAHVRPEPFESIRSVVEAAIDDPLE